MSWESLGPFSDIPKILAEWSMRRDDLNRAALSALQKALNATKKYLRDLERGDARQQDREDGIVDLWGEAGVQFRGVDNDLALACHYKAQYWINPDEWSEQKIADRRIGIELLFERYGELLYVSGAVLEPHNKSLIRKLREKLRLKKAVTK